MEERRRAAWRQRLIWGGSIAAVAIIITVVMLMLGKSVKESDLIIATVETAELESSVAASGKIVPLYEQTIVSPVATKILEVYCTEGDSVGAGQSLLRLDLQSTEADVRRMADDVSMKRIASEQTALNTATYITDLEMRIRTKEMSVSHLKAEVANERRLDSIGSGTGDRIREAELAYRTAQLELEQMRTQLANERKAHDATYRSRQIESDISARALAEAQRTLDDARVPAPRGGIVSYLNSKLGVAISQGEKLAVVSDLSHFKVDGEIPESQSGKLAVGSPVNVRINRKDLRGHISNISPQSREGSVSFVVLLDDDQSPLLRPGLRVDLNVIYDVLESVVRIPNGSYFQGAGQYVLFVRTSEGKLERRSVSLGESNFDFVEVRSGLKPGEQVVVSDMSDFKDSRTLRIRK